MLWEFEEKLFSSSRLWAEVRTQLITACNDWLLWIHLANEGLGVDVNSGDSELRLSPLQQSIHLVIAGESVSSNKYELTETKRCSSYLKHSHNKNKHVLFYSVVIKRNVSAQETLRKQWAV